MITPPGRQDLLVTIPRFPAGSQLACPVVAFEGWILNYRQNVQPYTADSSPWLGFPLTSGSTTPPTVGCSEKTVNRVVKTVAKAAGFDPDRYSGHSLQAGFAVAAAAEAGQERLVEGQSLEVLRRAIRNGQVWQNSPAAVLAKLT